MKKCSVYAAAAAFMLFSLASCSKPDETSKMIPANAIVIAHVNAASLSEKISWNDIQQTSWFREIDAETSDSLAKQLLSDPEKSGVDTDGDLVMFVSKNGNRSIVAVQGKIGNKDAFASFNQKLSDGTAPVKTDDFSTLSLKDEGVVTWNDKRFCYLFDAPGTSAAQYGMNDSGEGNPRISRDSLRLISRSYFQLDTDNSMADNKKFTSLLKEDGDMHLWLNSGDLYSDLSGGMLSMMRLNVLFDGNVSATTLSFEDGKVRVSSKQYYGKEMTDLIEKYKPQPIDAAIINRIPSQNVLGVFVMNYPPEGLKQFTKLIGVDGMINGYLGQAGYSIDEFVKANKGEMVVAVSDFSVEEKTMTVPGMEGEEPYTYSSSSPDMKFIFSTSINDKAAFDKLVGQMQAQIPQEVTSQISEKFTYKLDDKWFVMSNSPEYVDKFLAGGNNKLPFTDKIAGHPYAMYLDIQKMMAGAGQQTDSTKKLTLDASMKLWQDVVFYGGEIKDGAMISEGEINLIDKKTNSLKQINQYLDLLAKTYKSDKRDAEYSEDEASVGPDGQ